MSRHTPTVWVYRAGGETWAELEQPTAQMGTIRLESAQWWAWVAASSTTGFAYPLMDRCAGWIAGFMTVRNERRQRGGTYWTVYRRQGGRLRKIYLGPAHTLTHARLEAVAMTLLAERPVGEGVNDRATHPPGM